MLSTSKCQSGSESVFSPSKLAASLRARSRSWNSGRVGLTKGLARCCSDLGHGKTVALWRATTHEHGGWRCDKVKVKVFCSWPTAGVLVLTAVGPFHFMAGMWIWQCCMCCPIITQYHFKNCSCWFSEGKWMQMCSNKSREFLISILLLLTF